LPKLRDIHRGIWKSCQRLQGVMSGASALETRLHLSLKNGAIKVIALRSPIHIAEVI
jgi:hypothetical protein